MSAPLSYTRILAMLRRLSPAWPSTEPDKSVGKELGSLATALGMAADPVDLALDEVMPDTTTTLLPRWEGITRVSTHGGLDIVARRLRVLSVLRRVSGPSIDQLGAILATPLALDINDIIFVEMTRYLIEYGLTQIDATVRALSATPISVALGAPWPGKVDDTGVRLYVALNGAATPTVTLKSPRGTTWVVPVSGLGGWYSTRTAFLGESPSGAWTLTASNGSAVNITELRLLVSNDVDSAQIYNFFVYRDPTLAGTPDIAEAQRLLARTALGHFDMNVIQSMAFTCDDTYSLVDRDMIGE